jgi:hypothetical protein
MRVGKTMDNSYELNLSRPANDTLGIGSKA